MPGLVTYKHVIEGATDIEIICTLAENEKPSFRKLLRGEFRISHWFLHPLEDIDLAACPIDGFMHRATIGGKPPYITTVDEGMIADAAYLSNMDAVESILMVGYPIKISDERNNLPIVRKR